MRKPAILKVRKILYVIKNLSCPWIRNRNGRMLSARHFTFPLAARTSVASDGIVKSTAATHRAIT